MAKQMLFYESVTPLSAERHGNWSLSRGDDYSYAAQTNACPLMVSEFRAAAASLPIIFSRSGDTAMPAVVLGLEADKSLMVSEDGSWLGRYLPAFIRRYPFVFASHPQANPDSMMLCVDETFPGIDQTGQEGDRFFETDGTPTEMTSQAMEFTRSFEVESRRTQAFGKLLAEHDLLDPMNAEITLPNGRKRAISGFSVVSRERLKALSSDVVKTLFDSDALELIYIHMISMSNIEGLALREE